MVQHFNFFMMNQSTAEKLIILQLFQKIIMIILLQQLLGGRLQMKKLY